MGSRCSWRAAAALYPRAVAYAVQLSWNAGASWTTTKVGAFTGTTDANHTLGGVGDNWGRTWTASELSDANFQLRVYKTGGSPSLRVDRIQVKVYYTRRSRKRPLQHRHQRYELDGSRRGHQHHRQGLGRRRRRRWRRGHIPAVRGAAPGSLAPLWRSPPAKRSASGWAAAARGGTAAGAMPAAAAAVAVAIPGSFAAARV